MLKFKAIAIRLAEKPAEGTSPVPNKIQLLRTGSFNSEQYGKFKITAADLTSMVKNFNEKVRGYDDGRLPIDYFHENEKIAAGWIEALELSADSEELWATVTWTPRGEKHLADKELRYVSAEFHFNYVSNEGNKKFGPTLFGAGLTNRPFVKGMDAVVELTEGDNQMTLEQALAQIEELKKQIESLKAGKTAAPAPEDEAEMAAVKKQLADSQAKCAEYEAVAKKTAEEKALADKKAKFDLMLSEGKACEAQREPYMANDFVKFTESAQPVKLDSRGSSTGSNTDGKGKDAQDQIIELAQKMVTEKKISLSEAMKQVQRENPKLAEQYRAETSIKA